MSLFDLYVLKGLTLNMYIIIGMLTTRLIFFFKIYI